MEKKEFKRGTVAGGIVRIAISLVIVVFSAVFIIRAASSFGEGDNFGPIFMCAIGGIMVIASITFIINGIKMIMDGKKSLDALHNGHAKTGRIVDLFSTEVQENNNGCVSSYTIYSLKFEYTDDFGNLSESEEQVSLKIYEELQAKTLIPILVLKERAVFDKKKFEEENGL